MHKFRVIFTGQNGFHRIYNILSQDIKTANKWSEVQLKFWNRKAKVSVNGIK